MLKNAQFQRETRSFAPQQAADKGGFAHLDALKVIISPHKRKKMAATGDLLRPRLLMLATIKELNSPLLADNRALDLESLRL